MRDPTALHVGLQVLTPNGSGIVRARRGGPVTTWLVLDFWWRESQLAVPDEPMPGPDPEHLCAGCRHRRSGRPLSMLGNTHCYGHGGVIVDGESRPCGCACGARWRDELGRVLMAGVGGEYARRTNEGPRMLSRAPRTKTTTDRSHHDGQ